ncbi:hypothetical protein PVAND_013467 [Polypedilum vanderplanki]|uniref:Uncharacterized protein n=1 Tax=Polypedilum vanderplanki TaxID=319348 RepID=A0A9J6CQE8_POLVA|nr:hypothetical protein PVAND_013467 [Polypedilum vanderplanki]
MCPIRYLYHVLLFLLTNFLIISNANAATEWKAYFDPNPITIKTASARRVHLVLTGLSEDFVNKFNYPNHTEQEYIQLVSEDNSLANVRNQKAMTFFAPNKTSLDTNFDLFGEFLGQTRIFVEINTPEENLTERSNESLSVTILRPQRVIDKLFTYSVIVLVSILYINFGAALSLETLKEILRRPVGPIICFICQFVLMPLTSYGLGFCLFPNAHEMALGLFFTGISPGGGASNMWTLLLGGNIHLSIAMTTISTVAAFGMMPLWIFTLGKMIFDRANLGVPYSKIFTMAFGLVIPLALGLLIQKFLPRVARILVRILKPVSMILILFIIVFAIITNFYIFQLFSWQIVVAGLGLPWLGYTFGWVFSKLFRQPSPDCIAIAVETGIQNTGIAIFLLTFSLDQPMADLTTVVPVSVAIMTPFPLLVIYLIQRCMNLEIFKKREQCGYSPIAGRNGNLHPTQTASTLALSQICPLDSVGMAIPIDPNDQRVINA